MSARVEPPAASRWETLLAYEGEVVNVDHSWNPWGFSRGTKEPMMGIVNTMTGKEDAWKIMSYDFASSITPIAYASNGEVEVKAMFILSRQGMQKFASLWVRVKQNSLGYGDNYLGSVSGGTLMGQKYRFNNAAREWFASEPMPAIPSYALLDTDDADDWYDALMKAMDVYKQRDERTWSFRPSVRDSDSLDARPGQKTSLWELEGRLASQSRILPARPSSRGANERVECQRVELLKGALTDVRTELDLAQQDLAGGQRAVSVLDDLMFDLAKILRRIDRE